jgi:FtsP/CotA-like multicopper oxidase with cupredoxin domain
MLSITSDARHAHVRHTAAAANEIEGAHAARVMLACGALCSLVLGAALVAPAEVAAQARLVRSSGEWKGASSTARWNDNDRAAGVVRGNVRTVSLEVVRTVWMPGPATGRTVPVFAFAEAGRRASIPGPMLRLVAGTELRVSLRNRLDREVVIHGLSDHRGPSDSVTLGAGEERTVDFRATVPGTYFYWGRTTRTNRDIGRTEDSQLAGAFIVDEHGASTRPTERVMVMTAFDDTVADAAYPAGHFQVFAINGRSWPSTARESVMLGDTVTWRVINASDHTHPMHLHGFFFTVESRGTTTYDTAYAPERRRLAVTELLLAASTARLTWVADRPGNWLFHCHLIGHIDGALRLEREPGDPARPMHGGASHARIEDAMSGLVVAITIAPRRPVRAATAASESAKPARRLRLFVTERSPATSASPQLSYVMEEGGGPPAADSVRRPGTTLELRAHEPTEIVVINRARRATAVHWHGIELDSYFDGVAGWSGADARTAPLIAPGDSFVVRMTPPRAGTYIYHTHMDDAVQLKGGLFGALIVLPTGVTRRDTTERLLILTAHGPEPRENSSGVAPDTTPIELRGGVAHRLRLISIGASSNYRVRLLRDTTQVTWRPIARDGADLPEAQAVEQPARTLLGAGNTMDVELLRARGESLTLELRRDGVEIFRVPIHVR